MKYLILIFVLSIGCDVGNDTEFVVPDWAICEDGAQSLGDECDNMEFACHNDITDESTTSEYIDYCHCGRWESLIPCKIDGGWVCEYNGANIPICEEIDESLPNDFFFDDSCDDWEHLIENYPRYKTYLCLSHISDICAEQLCYN